MEPAGLLSLPVEILHSITQYLTVKDVLNCSETCHYLRMSFNYNQVWRKFVPEEVLQLEAQEQVLEPAFQWEDTFTPLCEYRVHYMRLIHLLHNWNTAKFAKYTLNIPDEDVYFNEKGIGQLFFNETYHFLVRYDKDMNKGIEVWDVGKKPTLHSFLNIRSTYYEFFYIIGSNLVVVDFCKVWVYQITLPEKRFPLLYTFRPTESEATRNEEEGDHHEHDYDCMGGRGNNVGQYLMFKNNKCPSSIIQVWDVVNATKVGAFALPVDGFKVSLLAHEGDEWLLRLHKFPITIYYLFNIKDKSFYETGFKEIEFCRSHIILYKSHIFSRTDHSERSEKHITTCVVYDIKTSDVKKRRFCTSKMRDIYSSLTIAKGYFFLHRFDHFEKIDALTLETVDRIQFKWDIESITYQLNIFGSIFVVANCEDDKLCMWNVAKNSKLICPLNEPDMHLYSDLELNGSMTKLVILSNNNINVLNFW